MWTAEDTSGWKNFLLSQELHLDQRLVTRTQNNLEGTQFHMEQGLLRQCKTGAVEFGSSVLCKMDTVGIIDRPGLLTTESELARSATCAWRWRVRVSLRLAMLGPSIFLF